MTSAVSSNDDDDVPWASPEIQLNYEAALGRFILAFNRLEYLLGEVMETVLTALGRQDLINDCVVSADFGMRLRYFDLLKHSSEGTGISDISVSEMRAIAAERNVLAHGHFDQNPFDGSYIIRTRRKAPYYSAERVEGLTERATKVWDALRYAEAYYAFASVQDVEVPAN